MGCSAAADPTVEFDQASFDAQMGTSAFALNEYYEFAYSANLPVPEPETYAMMLAGLGLLSARRVLRAWKPAAGTQAA